MKQTKHIFGLMGLSAMMLTACTANDSFNEAPDAVVDGDVYGNGSKVVSLTLSAEDIVGTRAELNHISDGNKVDVLYFQVYECDKMTDDQVTENKSKVNYAPVADGDVEYVERTALNVSSYPYTLKLSVDPEKSYKVALWAQTAACDAFDTEDLKEVVVDYTKLNNNFENSDAFCASAWFNGDAEREEIIMHRPFAQINVGTTGADYNNYMEGFIFPNTTVTKSQIIVKGVFNCINIFSDEVSKVKVSAQEGVKYKPLQGEIEATLEYALIPALYNKPNGSKDVKFGINFKNEELLSVKLNADNSHLYGDDADEEFADMGLTVDEKGLLNYKTKYPTIYKDEENTTYLTENFRWLSMSYVLVPNGRTADDSSYKGNTSENPYDPYTSSTLAELTVYFSPDNEEAGHKSFLLNTVPVHRNWRTNILGGLSDIDPDDPNGDDDTSVFTNARLCVHLCPIYFNEYTSTDRGQTFQYDENGFPYEDESWHDFFENHPSQD